MQAAFHSLLTLLLFGATAGAQTPSGAIRQFEERCANCHRNDATSSAPSSAPAPQVAALQKMTPETIYRSITTGSAAAHVQNVDDGLRRAFAEFLGGHKLRLSETIDAEHMQGRCRTTPSLRTGGSTWNGWGVDVTNSRFQSAQAAGLTAAQVPRLKLKWAFGFPDANSMYGQPAVFGGRVFVGGDTGVVYSLDAATGCVYWSFRADGGVRNAISVGTLTTTNRSTTALFFGDIKANLYAVDAAAGSLLWKMSVDPHLLATITGAPTLYRGRLYVPVASREEAAGGSINYPCCTFRGSIVAVDASTGKQIWKTYLVDVPKPTRKNSKGVQLSAPSGVGVWSSPTVDERRRLLYVATGDAYSGRPPTTSDAVLALDVETGKIRWTVQHTTNDAWLVGCDTEARSENCPEDVGPDYDFGASPVLRRLADGRTILISGQKSGEVYAQDAGRSGAVLWKATLVEKLARGEIAFGGAVDEQSAYFGTRSGISAIDVRTGARKWFTSVPVPLPPRRAGVNAAVTVIPGALFSGGWDGILRALATGDGRLLWQYDMQRDVTTVNGVPARGGSMGATGPTIADGMLFTGAGYIGVGGNGTPGDVLLAFAAE